MAEGLFHPDRLYSPREVAAIWHLPRDFCYEALHAGDLKAIRRNSRFLVPGWAVDEWLRSVAGGDRVRGSVE